MAASLQELLHLSAQRAGDAPAVRCESQQLTYGELECRSNQLAATLAAGGVGRGDRVGVHLDKSLAALIALFGILKTGAAYVPLDPASPAARAALIIADCQMKGLVSTGVRLAALRSAAADLGSLRCVVLSDGDAPCAGASARVVTWDEVLAAPATRLAVDARAQDLAYVLYTSGSTGRPKGVMIGQRNALAFVDWAQEAFQVGAADRVANHAPLHFDLSVFDLFATIKGGGTVVLVPPARSVFPRDLADFIADEQISIWYSVPSALTQLVRHGQLERHGYPNLRYILFAGEVFPVKYLRQLMELVPGPRYYNLYGPTETNVCTWYEVPPLDPGRTEPLSIGAACAEAEVHVLDDEGAPVPKGAEGELCVCGPAVMEGYWGDVDSRSAAGLEHCTHLGGKIIYRTGDIGRCEADGNITYLGRRDDMIKSRGYRIELGEIEAALYDHPEVEAAAAVPVPDDELGNRIKAFLVARDGASLQPSEVRTFCAARLPKYMVPHAFAVRASLPRTSTGKVDRALLRQEAIES